MGRLQLLNPFRIRAAVREIRRVLGGGGPKLVRLLSVGHPRGIIVPISEATIEVEAKDGTVSRFATALPVPWPYAWAYRIARRLRVPLVSDLEPGHFRFELPFPWFGK